MPHRIVVAMEGSTAFADPPPCALDCAGRLAARIGAELWLLHVEPPATSDLEALTPYRFEGVVEATASDRRRRDAQTREGLHSLEEQVGERWLVGARSAVATGPDPAVTGRLAREGHGELLVARQGETPCAAGYLAALPERVASDLAIPVLFLPGGTCQVLDQLERVLVLLDGSRYGELMLPLACRLLAPATGRLHLLATVPDPIPTALLGRHDAHLASRSEAEAYLDDVTGRPELTGVQVDWTVAVGSARADIVREVAATSRANLVAMMIRRPGATDRVLRRPAAGTLGELGLPLLLWSSPGNAGDRSRETAPD